MEVLFNKPKSAALLFNKRNLFTYKAKRARVFAYYYCFSGLINKACILNWYNKQKRQAFLFNTRGTFRQVPTRRIRLSLRNKCAYLDLRDIFFISLKIYNGFRYRKEWHPISKEQLWHILRFHFY